MRQHNSPPTRCESHAVGSPELLRKALTFTAQRPSGDFDGGERKPVTVWAPLPGIRVPRRRGCTVVRAD
ncbi:hypothetical protein BC826DRAFT_995059 [Russula brevipes]|nr:hypothetical protein BC826DRAFT_995059 [Russula brevipes]